ncbi:MAG: nitrilase-related carbon-nitrogen hydrolase [Bacteroidota bacterium]|jgi:predicted amidohydrolase
MIIQAAVAQIAPKLGDVQANIALHLETIAAAREAGAQLLVFPELSLTGYTVRDMNYELCLRIDDERLDVFRHESEDMVIILGGIEEDERYGVFNSAFVFDGGTTQTYRKIYPPDYGIFEEGRYFLRGDSAALIHTRFGRIGVLVCEDLWHPSLPMLQALDGAELLCVISASPTRIAPAGGRTLYDINSEHHRALCRLLTVNMVFTNRVGYEDGVQFWGGSEIIDATGEVLASCGCSDAELRIAPVDTDSVRAARRESRHFLDEDVYLLQRELSRVIGGREMRR